MAEEQKRKIILVVEDDSELQKLLKEKLEASGMQIIQATSAQHALGALKSQTPDLILLDIMLPGGMNGFDLLEQIKANDILSHIPVIVLTNLSTEQKPALDIGAADYIVKPNISIDEVILKIKNHLP